jgi:hypothetical protein
MMEHILTVDAITLDTTCASLVKKALMEFLKLPLRVIDVFAARFQDFQNCEVVDEMAIRVPTFYAPYKGHGFLRVRITAMIVAMLFGGIHCAGWNFPFPSHAELIIWRVSSLTIVIVPCTFVPPIVLVFMGKDATLIQVYGLVPFFGIAAYVLARFALFVEALISLRHLPPGAYTEVKWTALLLHM